RLDDDLRADQVARLLACEAETEPVVLLHVGDILQHDDRLVDVADDDIQPPVVVEVADRQAAADVLALEILAAALAVILEAPLAEVAQDDGHLSQAAAVGGMPDHVTVGNDDVEKAVVIEVEEAGSEADELLPQDGDAGRRGAVKEALAAEAA